MTDYPGRHSGHRFRHHTGAVGLIFHGERPQPKSSAEILETARTTEFFEEGRFRAEFAGGTIEYVPRTLVSDAAAEALARGLLVYKFRIGDDPPRMFRDLDPGEYYVYLDFIEGPDFQEGRWLGRIVNSLGGLECWVTGVEVKQINYFHLDVREDHSKPKIDLHGLGAEGTLAAGSAWWTDISSSWEQWGIGCKTTTVCVPVG